VCASGMHCRTATCAVISGLRCARVASLCRLPIHPHPLARMGMGSAWGLRSGKCVACAGHGRGVPPGLSAQRMRAMALGIPCVRISIGLPFWGGWQSRRSGWARSVRGRLGEDGQMGPPSSRLCEAELGNHLRGSRARKASPAGGLGRWGRLREGLGGWAPSAATNHAAGHPPTRPSAACPPLWSMPRGSACCQLHTPACRQLRTPRGGRCGQKWTMCQNKAHTSHP